MKRGNIAEKARSLAREWEREEVLGRGKWFRLAGGGQQGGVCVLLPLQTPLACLLLSNGMVMMIIITNTLKIVNITIISFLGLFCKD